MKRILIFFAALLLGASGAFGQILNGGFESWTADKPDDWTVDDTSGVFLRSTDAHSGSSAFLFHEAGGSGVYLATFLTNSTNAHPFGAQIADSMRTLSFWYKIASRSNPSIAERHTLRTQYGTIYWRSSALLGTDTIWKKVSLELPPPTFDSVSKNYVEVTFAFVFATLQAGASFDLTVSVDDVSLDSTSDLSAPSSAPPSDLSLDVFPNPVSSHANLRYRFQGSARIEAALYDPTGRKVKALPSLAIASGTGSIPFDCGDLCDGVYYIRADVGGDVVARMVIVRH